MNLQAQSLTMVLNLVVQSLILAVEKLVVL